MKLAGVQPPVTLTQSLQSERVSQIGQKKSADTVNETGQTFNELLQSLSQSQNESDTLLQKLAAGEDVDLHQVMIASEKTSVSFQVALSIRDRLVEAYREVMRTNV
jgi:flagellar hook-basal body complex protein FliE